MIFGASALAFLLASPLACSRGDQPSATWQQTETTIKTSPLDSSVASQFIRYNSALLNRIGLPSTQLDLDTDQLFTANFRGKQYFVVPVSRESKHGIAAFTCSLLLFSKEGKLVGGVDTLGSGEARPWTCGGVLALGFADLYSDGSLGIIVLYEGTAPSSEPFRLPIALRANLSNLVFAVDEQKTALLARKNVKTIKAAREVLR